MGLGGGTFTLNGKYIAPPKKTDAKMASVLLTVRSCIQHSSVALELDRNSREIARKIRRV